jgi:DNA adenine methylase
VTAVPAPALKWPGAKWNLAEWICGHLPPREVYVEPFFGSGAVFFTKPAAKFETINDLDEQVVNLFRVIRQQPQELARLIAFTPWARAEYEAACRPPTGNALEDAWALIVRSHQAFSATMTRQTGWRNDTAAGRNTPCPATWRQLPERILATADRLANAHIENRPALELIARSGRPEVLLYVDPPYMPDARSPRLYPHEMTASDHSSLLAALEVHPGPIVLSGYTHPLYDSALAHWRRIERTAFAEGGRERTEVLWLNPVCARRLERAHDQARLLEVPA